MPKIVVLCGSSRFIDIMATCAWLIEKNEKAISLGLHLLPSWYPDVPAHHLAEHEGVADEMDALHLRKIDLADEIFVVNYGHYIGNSTMIEIQYAKEKNIPVRFFMSDPIGLSVRSMLARLAHETQSDHCCDGDYTDLPDGNGHCAICGK